MKVTRIALFLLFSLASARRASALLQQFSVADGYQDPFATRVWTYNSLWHFDGGALGNNYVAQHGYGAGFPFGEPFALVVRNDNPAGNYRFSYDFVAGDLGGLNPASLGSDTVQIQFDACATVVQGNVVANAAPMLTMAFGGTRPAPGLTIGFSDSNHLMWSDAGGVLQEFTGHTFNAAGWDRITLAMDFANDTYDLSVTSMAWDGSSASSAAVPLTTYSVASGVAFTNSLSSLEQLYFETFTDPDQGGSGWHKAFLDNFGSPTAEVIPEPASATLVVMGLVAWGMRRRRRRAS